MRNDSTSLIDSGYGCVKNTRYGYMLYNKFDMYIGRSLDLYGEFSYYEAQIFDQLINQGFVVLDVGANIGAFTVLFSKLASQTGRIFAFEPQRITYQMLCANVALNALLNVETFNHCVGNKKNLIDVTELEQYKITNFGGLSMGADANKLSRKVRTILIDELELKQCNFIKIDVEGMEKEALLGAKKTIQKHHPIMYIENDRVEKSVELIKTIKEFGYVIYEHNPYLFNKENFFGCDVNIFGNIVSKNLLCIHNSIDMKVNGLKEI